jgi:hypothetical protein
VGSNDIARPESVKANASLRESDQFLIVRRTDVEKIAALLDCGVAEPKRHLNVDS